MKLTTPSPPIVEWWDFNHINKVVLYSNFILDYLKSICQKKKHWSTTFSAIYTPPLKIRESFSNKEKQINGNQLPPPQRSQTLKNKITTTTKEKNDKQTEKRIHMLSKLIPRNAHSFIRFRLDLFSLES